jgi:hypothetical protein
MKFPCVILNSNVVDSECAQKVNTYWQKINSDSNIQSIPKHALKNISKMLLLHSKHSIQYFSMTALEELLGEQLISHRFGILHLQIWNGVLFSHL